MQISDSDKPKLIVLICLVILVLAYGGYRMKSVVSQVVPPSAESKKSVETTANSQLPTADNNILPLIPAKRRDPFEPQVKPVNPAETSTQTKIKLPFFNNHNLPPLPIQIKNGTGSQVVVVPEPLPDFKLVGIITGDRNLAVIKGDSLASYMVYEGQYIKGKYLVKSISSTSVSIQYRDQITVLKLGGKDAVHN